MVQNVPKDIQIFRYLQLVVRSGELTEKQLTSPMISDFKYHYANQGGGADYMQARQKVKKMVGASSNVKGISCQMSQLTLLSLLGKFIKNKI